MTKPISKIQRVRLDSRRYRALHSQILQRDGWRCQSCGSMQNLLVHHALFRSHSGADVEDNLITLCANCRAQVHRWKPQD